MRGSVPVLSDVIMCTVAPPVMHAISNAIKITWIKAHYCGAGIKTGVIIKYETRGGWLDKIVNAAAALRLYGGPVIC